MDESFAYFYTDEGFGPAVHAQPVPEERIAAFQRGERQIMRDIVKDAKAAGLM